MNIVKATLFLSILLMAGCTNRKDDKRNVNSYRQDFESIDGWYAEYGGHLEKLDSHGGNYSFRMTPELEYGPTFRKPLENMRDWPMPYLNVGVWVKSDSVLKEACLVVAIYDTLKKENVFYKAIALSKFFTQHNAWYQPKDRVILPSQISPTTEISIYIWNKSRETFLIDDIEFEFSKS